MNEEFKEGWYWVKRHDRDVWLIGHTTDGVDYFINGNYVGLVYEIGERIPTNDELTKRVVGNDKQR